MIDNRKISELTVDEAMKLMKAIFDGEDRTLEVVQRKASNWLADHDKMVNVDDIIDSVEVAQMTLAEDFEKWDEMKDDEKNDLAEMMCGLMVARDLLADMFGRPTKGRVEKVVEEDG